MSFGERLFWEKYYQAMISYKIGGDFIKGIPAYFVAFLIFLLGNFGTRVLGFAWFLQKLKKIRELDYLSVFIGSIIIVGVIIPMFLVQKGTPWNTIQFFYYSLFFMGIVSGIFLSRFLSKITIGLQYAVIGVVFSLTLPTTVTTMKHYLPSTPPAKIGNFELEALSFLEKKPQGRVLSLQIPGIYYEDEHPMPLYEYDSTAYVSAFSNKPVFLEDVVNLNIMNYNWPARLEKIKTFLEDSNSENGKNFLRDEGIDYIYLVKRSGVGLHEPTLGLKNIFENEEVIIYKVSRF